MSMENSLTTSQQQALEVLTSSANCFIDGLAGTGKTFLLDYYTKHYCTNKKVLKCSFTANAVNNLTLDKPGDEIGTIHTVFRFAKYELPSVIPPKKWISWWDSRTYYSKFDVIIIDEISMCRIDYFWFIFKIIQKANKYRKIPIQIIVSGDFGQLPPIITPKELKILKKKYHSDTCYAFEHECWKLFNFKTISLSDNIRINKDRVFIDHLRNLRSAKDLDSTLRYFNSRVIKTNKIKDTIRLFATNRLVEKTNLLALKRLKGKQVDIKAYYDFEVRDAINKHQLSSSDLPSSLVLSLKNNAQVMFVKNDKLIKDKGRRFVNGDLGQVIKVENEDEVVVLVKRTGKKVRLHKYNLAYNINKAPKLFLDVIVQDQYIGLFKQYPIKLAYGLTIHKAQGKTFDNVVLDPTIDKAKLTPGLIYVALSRVRSIDNLYLTKPLTIDQITIDPKVVDFYKNLK